MGKKAIRLIASDAKFLFAEAIGFVWRHGLAWHFEIERMIAEARGQEN